ncbi:hypothetical protein [Fidelibacter multiformis]|uniref:hypothetical protein n=1 Tax=Fidelibacter multiformis TaxID=3377529 RepID=UPI0037DD6EFA
MEKLNEIFNNRELASIIWLVIIGLYLQINKSTREASKNLLKAFFQWKITSVILLALSYSAAIVWILWTIKFWDQALLKDIIIWFIASSFFILMNLNKAEKEKNFFKNILRDNLKLILILEFVINFHQFSLLAEMFILPALAFLAMLQVIAEKEERTKIVKTEIDWIFVIIAVTFLIISIRDITNDITGFANYSNLKSFLLPVILSISFIPCAYLIAVFMNYEMLFVRLGFYLKNKGDLRFAKLRTLQKCGLQISKIRTLSPKINSLYNGSTREEIKDIIS